MHIGHHRHPKRKHEPLRKRLHALYGIDALAYLVSLLSLFFTLDQVRIIWVEQNADGVSLISWVFYTLSSIIWLVYGIAHKDRVLIITNFLWVLFSICVVAGVALYQ